MGTGSLAVYTSQHAHGVVKIYSLLRLCFSCFLYISVWSSLAVASRLLQCSMQLLSCSLLKRPCPCNSLDRYIYCLPEALQSYITVGFRLNMSFLASNVLFSNPPFLVTWLAVKVWSEKATKSVAALASATPWIMIWNYFPKKHREIFLFGTFICVHFILLWVTESVKKKKKNERNKYFHDVHEVMLL